MRNVRTKQISKANPSIRWRMLNTTPASESRIALICIPKPFDAMIPRGTVFAVGALFTIMHARSGSMDAIESFIGSRSVAEGWFLNLLTIISIALAMLVAALLSHLLLRRINERLSRLRSLLCSRELAIASLAFVSGLSLVLTGVRGALLMVTAAVLGIIPPLCGIRRIQLMGCLLVPISITLLE